MAKKKLPEADLTLWTRDQVFIWATTGDEALADGFDGRHGQTWGAVVRSRPRARWSLCKTEGAAGPRKDANDVDPSKYLTDLSGRYVNWNNRAIRAGDEWARENRLAILAKAKKAEGELVDRPRVEGAPHSELTRIARQINECLTDANSSLREAIEHLERVAETECMPADLRTTTGDGAKLLRSVSAKLRLEYKKVFQTRREIPSAKHLARREDATRPIENYLTWPGFEKEICSLFRRTLKQLDQLTTHFPDRVDGVAPPPSLLPFEVANQAIERGEIRPYPTATGDELFSKKDVMSHFPAAKKRGRGRPPKKPSVHKCLDALEQTGWLTDPLTDRLRPEDDLLDLVRRMLLPVSDISIEDQEANSKGKISEADQLLRKRRQDVLEKKTFIDSLNAWNDERGYEKSN